MLASGRQAAAGVVGSPARPEVAVQLGTCIPRPPAPGLPRLHHPHACGVSGQWEMRPARPRASALLAPSSPAPHTTCRLPVVEESLGPPCCTATAPTFLLQHPSILREVLTLSKPPGTTRSHSRAVTVLPGAGPPPRGCPCAWLSSFRPAPGAGVWLSPRAIRPAGPSLTRHMQEVLRTPAFSSAGQEWDCLVAAWGLLHSHLSGSEYHLAPPRRGLAPPDLTVQPGFCPMTSQAGGTLTTRWPAWGW